MPDIIPPMLYHAIGKGVLAVEIYANDAKVCMGR